jgi:mono/diheme cytochrome c family protein
MIQRNNHIFPACAVVLITIASQVHAEVLDQPADLDLDAVVVAINFGTTTDQTIRGATFRAATANSTVGGLKNRAVGTVGVKQYKQTFPKIGSTKDDNSLEQILGTSIFGQSGEKSIKITVDVPNGLYRAQLIIYDGWQSVTGNKRDVNHYVEGVLASGHYQDFVEQNGTPDAGSVVSYVFEVLDGHIDLSVEGLVPNAHLSGLIISKLPSLNATDLKPGDKLVQIRQQYSAKEISTLFVQHCHRCHNDKTQKGDIRLDNVKRDFAQERELWEKIEQQIATNEMPPEKPFLSDGQRLEITDWINTQKDKVDWSAHRQAGHVVLPMLNRNEYENTVRALFNDETFDRNLTYIDFFRSLSDDGVGDTGFSSDRDSPSLAMTGARLEKYIRITEDVLDHYLYTDKPILYQAEAEKMKATTAVLTPTENGIMIKANRDSLYTRWHYPRSGWYVINVKAWGERVDNRACAEMVIYLDREEVGQVRLLSTRAQPGDYHCLVWIENGHHTLRFRPQRSGMTRDESLLPVPPPFPDKPIIADFNDLGLGTGVYMCMDKMQIHGPVNQLPEDFNRNENYTEELTGPPTRSIITQQNTPAAERNNDLAWEKQTKLTINREVSHEEISSTYTHVWVMPLLKTDFSAPPPVARLIAADGDGSSAARQVISRFGARAFRRPVSVEDVDFFLKFYEAAAAAGADHRAGLKAALFAIMISPDFFYRIPQSGNATEERRLDSFEMASRLSYFLWNSMPDEELFALAEADKLTDPGVIDRQVVRMLQNTQGKRMVGLFAREWLGYRELGVTIKPDDALFKNTYYANNIEGLFKEETETFVNYIFSENRPLEELITADYAFWNKRLAHYYPGSNAASELLAASIHGSPDVDIAVPNGSYTLQLLLYEGWQSRSADIVIEGKTIWQAYNMFDEQGKTFDHGSVLRYTFTLTDGNIDLEFKEHKPNIHLGGLILTKGNGNGADSTAILESNSDLDFKDVIKAINFGDTRHLRIGNVKFTAAAVNTTVDGVTNKAAGDVYAGQYSQKLPTILKDKSHVQLGDDLTKVQLSTNSSRGGLLGMGSILTVTSHPTRTSAVDRGLWVYEKLFGKHLPEPPVVPALAKGTGEAGATRTFREVLEKHRENRQCASCHNKIDPIGFGLENFDPIGRWRTVDGGKSIDATGVLPDGGTFSGPRELKQKLVKKKTDFYRNMAQTVLTYALGRKLEFYDRPEVDKIVRKLMDTDGQSHELFKMVAKSYPFTHASSRKSFEESK